MKITKCQFYATVFGLVGGISLTGNIYLLKRDRANNQRQTQLEYELKQAEYETLELKKIEEIGSINDLNTYFSGKLRFFLDESAWMSSKFQSSELSPQLKIIGTEGDYQQLEISDALYEKINYVLSKYCFQSLYLVNLGNEFDLSRLDILNPEFNYLVKPYMDIEEIVLDNCKKEFNYEILSALRPTNIKISQIEWTDSVENWLKNVYLKNKEIEIYSDIDSNQTEKYLTYLADSEKEIGTLIIVSNSNENHLKLLSKINAKNIVIDSRSYYQENLDFDLTLHENTESIQLAFSNYDGVVNEPNKLGNIKITSPNSSLEVSILSDQGLLSHANSITYITKDTILDLPESSTISLHRINYMYQGEKQTLSGNFNYRKEETVEQMIQRLIEENIQKKIGQK